MLKRYGKDVIEELKELDRIDAHYKVEDYLELEQYFKNKII
jgi:hypothetical protein